MPDQNQTRLGWIGTGGMGLPMLTRLVQAGYRVTCFDVDPSRRTRASEAGAAIAQSPAAVAGGSDAVFINVPNGDIVNDVVFGRDGCVAGGMRDKLVIDTTSMDPVLTCDYAARLSGACGGRWLDAPVSGGVGGAAQGTLVALVGGDATYLEMARPWISSFARKIVHLGPQGSGQWAKLCNQAVICGTAALWMEALELGRNGGIDPHALVAALAGATSDSYMRVAFGEEMAAGTYVPSANLHKDLRTALKYSSPAQQDMIATAERAFAAMRSGAK